MTASATPDDRWRDAAACRDRPVEWFTGPWNPGDVGRALDVCATCAVRRPCLHAALAADAAGDLGIWGGTTEATRHRIRQGGLSIESTVRSRSSNGTPATPPTVEPDRATAKQGLELFRDDHGDFTDQTGRVTVFTIHGDPPLMVLVDGRPSARVDDLREAAEVAGYLVRSPVRQVEDHGESMQRPCGPSAPVPSARTESFATDRPAVRRAVVGSDSLLSWVVRRGMDPGAGR